jgi:hypothetical protein
MRASDLLMRTRGKLKFQKRHRLELYSGAGVRAQIQLRSRSFSVDHQSA